MVEKHTNEAENVVNEQLALCEDGSDMSPSVVDRWLRQDPLIEYVDEDDRT